MKDKHVLKNNKYFYFFCGGFLTVIIIIAWFIRIYQIDKLSFWFDETFSYVSSISSFKTMVVRDLNMTLFHVISHYWLIIIPRVNEANLRILPLIFSILSIPSIFFLGKNYTFFGKKFSYIIGLSSALLLTFNNFHVQYSQEFRSYSLVFLLTLLTTLFLIKAVEKTNLNSKTQYAFWFLYIITAASSVYAHLFANFIILAHIISFLILVKNNKFINIKKIFIIYSIIFALISPLIYAGIILGPNQINWIAKPNLNVIGIFFIKLMGGNGAPLSLVCLYILAILFALVTIIKLWLKFDLISKWKIILIVLSFITPILLSLIISQFGPHIFFDRYLLLTMPYLIIFCSLGIFSIILLGNKKNAFIKLQYNLYAILLLALIITFSFSGDIAYSNAFPKAAWSEASDYLSKNCNDNKTLRLYYTSKIETMALTYNPNLKSQLTNWVNNLTITTNAKDLEKLIPLYKKTCLTLGEIKLTDLKTLDIINSALMMRYTKTKDIYLNYLLIRVYQN